MYKRKKNVAWHQLSLHLSVISEHSVPSFKLTKEWECIFSPVQPWTARNPEGKWEWRSAGWRERDTSDVWREVTGCGVINGGACQAASVHLILSSKNTDAPHHVHEIDIIPPSDFSQWNIDVLTQNLCEDVGGAYLQRFLKCKILSAFCGNFTFADVGYEFVS